MAGCEITNNFNRKVLNGEWRLGCEAALDHVYMSQEKVWLRGWQTSMIIWSPSSKDWPSRVGGWRPAGIVLSMGPHPWIFRVSLYHRLHCENACPLADGNLRGAYHYFIIQVLTSFSPRHFLLLFLVMRDCSCFIWLCLSLKMKC